MIAETLPELSPPASPFGGIIESLVAPRQRIEMVFTEVGDLLTRSSGLLDQISHTFEALPAELERPELKQAMAKLTEVGERAGAFSQSFAEEQQGIERLVDVVGRANRPIEELRRTIRMMGILAINARVVAASVRNLQDSEVFTRDIADLSASAAKTIADFSQIYAKVRSAVQQAAQARSRFEEDHSRSLGDLSVQIGGSLAALGEQLSRSSEGSAETVALSRGIGQRVMTAVMALQVGDSTRQRVEHVEGVLRRAEDSAPLQQPLADLAGALLDDAVRTLDGDVTEAQQALAELARDARSITVRSREVYGDGDSGESVLSRLSADMRRATAVLADCDRERRVLAQVAEGVEAAVRVLIKHVVAVQHIESEMRLVSLNAAIRCAQLGEEGAALNVIARQLRDLTADTVGAAESAAESLNEAAELTMAFAASSGEEAAERMARLEQDAVDGVALLEGVEQRLRQALSVLADAGPRVADLLEGASGGFADHQSISEALSDSQIRIVALGGAEAATPEPGSDLATVLAAIRKSYTMAEERRIHDRMWGAPATAAAAAPVLTVVAAADDAEDLFEDFSAVVPDEADMQAADDLGLDLFDEHPGAELVAEPVVADEPIGTVEDDVTFF